MALINRPLTDDEARQMLVSWREGWPQYPTLWDMIRDAGPTPHVVRYHRDTGVHYTPPTHFYMGRPSDCTWIVPGTLERKI